MSLNIDRQGHYGEQALHAKYVAHRHGRKRPSTETALGEKGDDYPTPCLYVNHLYCYNTSDCYNISIYEPISISRSRST